MIKLKGCKGETEVQVPFTDRIGQGDIHQAALPFLGYVSRL